MMVSSQVAFMTFPSFDYERLTRDAAKFREHIGIMNLVPVAKTWTNEFRSRGPRSTFDNKMLPVEKIFGIIRIAGHIRNEAGKGGKRSVRQLPSVADEFRDSPPASSSRMRSHRRRRPGSEIEIAVAGGRCR